MSVKIKELAEQAGYLPDMFGIGHWDMPECQKFAELIVRECMEWCDAHATIDGSAQQIRNSIKKHFGVEE
jgi:hypothetical protein